MTKYETFGVIFEHCAFKSSAAFGRLHYYIKAKTKSTFSMCTQVSRGVKLSQFPLLALHSIKRWVFLLSSRKRFLFGAYGVKDTNFWRGCVAFFLSDFLISQMNRLAQTWAHLSYH